MFTHDVIPRYSMSISSVHLASFGILNYAHTLRTDRDLFGTSCGVVIAVGGVRSRRGVQSRGLLADMRHLTTHPVSHKVNVLSPYFVCALEAEM